MRRPPDKDRIRNAGLSERDVSSSNATLNTVFGGARQKSWMVGAGTSVRPSPRPSLSKAESYQGPSAQRPGLSVLPSLAPSDDNCPVLPTTSAADLSANNNNSSRIHARENSDAVVLNRAVVGEPQSSTVGNLPATILSSSPSRRTQWQQQQQQQQRAGCQPQPQSQTRPQLHLDPQYQQPQGQENFHVVGAQSPSILTANTAIPPSGTNHTEAAHGVCSPSELETRAPRPEAQILSPSPLTSECSPSPPPDRQPLVAESNSQARQGDHQSPPGGPNILASGLVASARPPSTTVMPESQASSSSTMHPSMLYNHQRTTRTANPVTQPLRLLRDQIKQYVSSVGGVKNLNNGLERPRFQLLEDACCLEDSFYIALHQIFCTWDLPDPNRITSIPGFPSFQVLSTSFKTLGSLLRDNDGLAPSHKNWFAQFPSPIEVFMNTSGNYRQILVYVGTFLRALPAEWALLAKACANRGYPPLIDELVTRLGVLSPILQNIMFTAVRRNLFLDDGVLGAKVEHVFKRDRREWDALRARCHTAMPPTANEKSDQNLLIANEYRKLVGRMYDQEHHRRPAGRSPLVARIPTPVFRSASVQSPISATSLSSYTQATQDLSQQSNPNLILGSNWEPVPQGPQTTGTISNNSPIASVHGSAPDVLDQRPYTLSGPAPVQGVPMQMQVPTQSFHPALGRNNELVGVNPDAPNIVASSLNESIYYPQVANSDPRMQQIQQLFALQQQQSAALQQQQQQQDPGRQAWQHLHTLQQQQQHLSPGIEVQRLYPLQVQQAQFSNQTPHRRSIATAVDHQPATNSASTTIPIYDRRDTGVVLRPDSATPGRRPPMVESIPTSPCQKPKHYPNRPLLPPPSAVRLTYLANSSVSALHQAHLRSPILAIPNCSYLEKAEYDPSRRYYQTVSDLSSGPIKIAKGSRLVEFDFNLLPDELALIPKDVVTGSGKPLTRNLKPGSLQYRMRCVQPVLDVSQISITDWVVSDTSWPHNCFLSLNQTPLEIRRKNHHGKDLPIDITQHILASGSHGSNHVTVATPLWTQDMKGSAFLAIERVELLHHDQIIDMCLQQQRIPASKTLDDIKIRLAPKDIDEDVAIVNSDLVLSLADPFTAQIFKIPVRGSSCFHYECFDLETFLMTRFRASNQSQLPCMVDVWKCPLCGKDARPHSLRVDEFLTSVRADLTARNELDVKAILISPDGRWRSVLEPQGKRKASFEPGDLSSDDGRVKKRDSSTTGLQQDKSKMVEVIELDED